MDTPSSGSTFPSVEDMGGVLSDMPIELDKKPIPIKISYLKDHFRFDTIDDRFEDIGYLICKKGDYTGIFYLDLDIFVILPVVPGGNPFFGKISTYGSICYNGHASLYIAINSVDPRHHPVFYEGVVSGASLYDIKFRPTRAFKLSALTQLLAHELATGESDH